MEIVEKNNSGKPGLLAIVLLAAGFALLGWSMSALPTAPAYGFPWEFALAVASFLPIMAGGLCLDTLAVQRRDPSFGDVHGNGGAIPFAMFVIVVGALLLGFNSGVLAGEWRRVFFSWQMLVLVGAMSEYARRRFTGASVMLAVGGFFILRRLAPLYPDIAASGAGDTFWPVLLIVAGVLILGSVLFKPRHGGWHENCHHSGHGGRRNNSDGKDGAHASGVIDTEVVFGGCEQVYLDPVFRGGKISTVFGGVKLDLRRAELPEGETWLKVESVFGGVEIDAPEDWAIEIRNESVFGGFADKRLPPTDGYVPDRKLIIKASSVFGGGEIK